MYKVLVIEVIKFFFFFFFFFSYKHFFLSCKNDCDKNRLSRADEESDGEAESKRVLIKSRKVPSPGETGTKNTWVCAACGFRLAGVTGPGLHRAVWLPAGKTRNTNLIFIFLKCRYGIHKFSFIPSVVTLLAASWLLAQLHIFSF